MASGKFSKAFTQYDYEVIVEWSSEADTASNSSIITADISLYCAYSLRTSQHEGSKITINNVEYPFTSPTINANRETVHLATITSNAIAHNSDGNKSVNIVCDYAVNATISGTRYGTITASDTVDLDLIPRQATLTSAENFNDDESQYLNKLWENYQSNPRDMDNDDYCVLGTLMLDAMLNIENKEDRYLVLDLTRLK